jgi:hypothetical protein
MYVELWRKGRSVDGASCCHCVHALLHVAAAGLMQALDSACCTLNAALQHHHQMQQQQQTLNVTALARISVFCLSGWQQGVDSRAAAAASAASNAESSGTADMTAGQPDYSWLLSDPASAAVLPAVAQLAAELLQRSLAVTSTSSSSSSSSSRDAGLQEKFRACLEGWSLTRAHKPIMACNVVDVISTPLLHANDADAHTAQVQALLAEPQLQRLLLLDLALAVQALHNQQRGVAPMPAIAAAVAAALPYSYSSRQDSQQDEQQHGVVDPWHEQLLQLLGVHSDELDAVAAGLQQLQHAANVGEPLDILRAAVVFERYMSIRTSAGTLGVQQQAEQQAEQQSGSSSSIGRCSSGSSSCCNSNDSSSGGFNGRPQAELRADERAGGSSSSSGWVAGIQREHPVLLANDYCDDSLHFGVFHTLLELLLLVCGSQQYAHDVECSACVLSRALTTMSYVMLDENNIEACNAAARIAAAAAAAAEAAGEEEGEHAERTAGSAASDEAAAAVIETACGLTRHEQLLALLHAAPGLLQVARQQRQGEAQQNDTPAPAAAAPAAAPATVYCEGEYMVGMYGNLLHNLAALLYVTEGRSFVQCFLPNPPT